MKKVLISLFLVMNFNYSFAHGDIKKSMEEMGQQFKIIATALQNKSLSAVELSAAEIMLAEIIEISELIPHTATTKEQKELYKELMEELKVANEELVIAIEEVLQSEDQVIDQVVALFLEMNEIRKKAHFEFKED